MEIGSEEWGRLVRAGAGSLGVEVEAVHLERFARHAAELLNWNSVTNLTAITRPDEVALNHFADSLACARLVPPKAAVLDVGSGGGFPGLPLHVVLPDLKTRLVDASRKKVSFLRHVIRVLDLKGIEACHSRIEDLGARGGGPGYQVIVSRAYSALAVFVRQALPLLEPDGKIIAYKVQIAPAEMRELLALAETGGCGGRLAVEERRYTLPGLRMERVLLIVRRRAGSPGQPD
jgi:16S rRNA (guanine527-N7)-methyltransferase